MDEYLDLRDLKHEPIPIPKNLELTRCYTTIFCCLKPKWYKKYESNLKTVSRDQNENLDILNLMRRMRAHGFAISTLLEPLVLTLVSERS